MRRGVILDMAVMEAGRERRGLLEAALRASLVAGEAVLKVYNTDFEVCLKEDQSPLTEADRQAHHILAAYLSGDIPFLSEEGSRIPFEDRKGWNLYWLVDPLDGTKEFIKRNGEFTVNVALIERGSPALGVVYVPARNELFFGGRGCGAFRVTDGAVGRIRQAGLGAGRMLDAAVDAAVPLPGFAVGAAQGIRLVQSASHVTPEEARFVTALRAAVGNIETVAAGSSLKFCRVAEGRADLYPRFGPTMEWDTAAGQCIAESAGGEVWSIPELSPVHYNRRDLRNGAFITIGSRIKAQNSLTDQILRCARDAWERRGLCEPPG